jgi:hypothetical protein
MRSTEWVRLWVALAMLCLAGCASHSRNLADVRAALVAGDVPGAIKEFEARKEKDTDLLYLLERGYMMHLAGRWAESNEAFEAAEQRSDELYTKSVTRQAAAFLTSDLALPYRGMPYELQLVQYYRALNYLELGRPDEALVEARKANFKLTQYAEAHVDDPALRQDAFLQYFTGLLYESEKEVNDAVVSFRDAASLYRQHQQEYGVAIPSWLPEDYLAAAEHLDLTDEVDSLVAAQPDLRARAKAHDDDNLVVFFESGFVPHREPVDITLPIFHTEEDGDNDEGHTRVAHHYVDKYGRDVYRYRRDRLKAEKVKLDHVLRFSFPALVEVPSRAAFCELERPDGEIVRAELALDLTRVAETEFQDRLGGLLLKTVARALAKEATRKAAKKQGEGLGWLVNAVNVATEQADTRGWIFLPGRINMLKTRVAPGSGPVKARFLDRGGRVLEEWELNLALDPGERRFISLRCFK